ncbi:MAG: RIP metalloprotease RseP [Bacilli bacterium]
MTLIYFILILGITIFIHEFGHFLFAKKAGIHCYEFSLGMGPKIFKFNRKNDETDYCIRLFPIGGFVSMAGEQVEVDKNVPPEKQMVNKKWGQRFITVIAGVMFNFIFAIILLFVIGLINGVPNSKPYIGKVVEDSPSFTAGLRTGDLVTAVNGKKVLSVDNFLLQVQINKSHKLILTVGDKDIVIKKNNDHYGFSMDQSKEHGFIAAIKYAFLKFASLITQMVLIICYLVTGVLSLNNLAGPVGIYTIVGQSAEAGFINLVYLTALLSINVGFLNLLPIPAFDGGRLLFLLIEKIKGRPINPKVENIIHSIGFIILMMLMIAVTYNDIVRLIK